MVFCHVEQSLVCNPFLKYYISHAILQRLSVLILGYGEAAELSRVSRGLSAWAKSQKHSSAGADNSVEGLSHYNDFGVSLLALMAENGSKDDTAKVCPQAGGRTSHLCVIEHLWACLSTVSWS